MIDFRPLALEQKADFDRILHHCGPRGCEYSFANLYIWGRQKAAFIGETLVFFSQFNRKSVYPFPVGGKDLKPALDAIIHDAQSRGISCRLTSLSQDDCALLEQLYPGKFRFHFDRDFFALPLPFCGTAIKNTDSRLGIGVIFIRESLRDYCCLQAVRSCRYIRLYQ